MVKCLAVAPFITFEYYLILFEHIFVDTSHLISGPSNQTFISQSPAGSRSGRARRRSYPTKVGDAAKEMESRETAKFKHHDKLLPSNDSKELSKT